jgi:hypothetical protein
MLRRSLYCVASKTHGIFTRVSYTRIPKILAICHSIDKHEQCRVQASIIPTSARIQLLTLTDRSTVIFLHFLSKCSLPSTIPSNVLIQQEQNLHSVLTLDPGSNVSSPSKRSSEGSKDVVPLNPASVLESTGLLLQSCGSGDGKNACSSAYNGDKSEKTRGHLGHDGSENLGRRVFLTFPGHILSHGEGGEGCGGRHGGGLGGDSRVGHGCECSRNSNDYGEDEEGKLGHFVYFLKIELIGEMPKRNERVR